MTVQSSPRSVAAVYDRRPASASPRFPTPFGNALVGATLLLPTASEVAAAVSSGGAFRSENFRNFTHFSGTNATAPAARDSGGYRRNLRRERHAVVAAVYDRRASSTPTGLDNSAQGWRTSAYPGSVKIGANPVRVESRTHGSHDHDPTPTGLGRFSFLPRVARSSQPWAELSQPFQGWRGLQGSAKELPQQLRSQVQIGNEGKAVRRLGMSNRTYVCLSCRTTKRAKPNSSAEPDYRCRLCGGNLEQLDWRRRVPRKTDNKGWNELRVYLAQLEYEYGPRRTAIGISKVNKIDRLILLEDSRPKSPTSEKKIKVLKYNRRAVSKAYNLP